MDALNAKKALLDVADIGVTCFLLNMLCSVTEVGVEMEQLGIVHRSLGPPHVQVHLPTCERPQPGSTGDAAPPVHIDPDSCEFYVSGFGNAIIPEASATSPQSCGMASSSTPERESAQAENAAQTHAHIQWTSRHDLYAVVLGGFEMATLNNHGHLRLQDSKHGLCVLHTGIDTLTKRN